MAYVTSDGVSAPDYNNPGDIVPGLATMADSIQSALEKRGNSYRGTSAQRESFRISAPEGTLWSDTNGDKALYIKRGANWSRVWPDELTPWETRFLSPQAGWRTHADSLDSVSRIRRKGEWVYISWVFQRTGGTISVPASGNIVNQSVGILKPEWRPSTWQAVGCGESGRLAGIVIGSNGHIRLNSVAGTNNITKNETFSLRGWYLRSF